ncbi:pyrroline-5-carboxylate reductase [Variovorax sp. EBFNA2]|uniref:pyrroline-5-carboxylate reductase n=1 Tax=Variovorax sp. EBFNA2 TaxID=3342097 RepID=UPI0029C0F57A|nr:pyrroline-5-carboxylate reductase [Variovorax boronicumulans]WPG41405.1 pyrroline-5-carboxylate reductase [Variovorax boronicumulans]
MNSEFSKAQPGSFAFIGGGQMATALISGLIRAGLPPQAIVVFDPDTAQQERLRTSLGVDVGGSVDARLATAHVVVWAVKPQVLRQAVQQASAHLRAPLHISIAAGIRCVDLSGWLGSTRVVRAMPNTSALIGASVTGLSAAPEAATADRRMAEEVLATTGHCFWVEGDERLNAVTAVSGSGPAYVFHFLEAFQAAAQAVGFDEVTARELVLKTVAGAVQQAQSGDAFGTLRERVTSRHGTTEAALAQLDLAGTADALKEAVAAACTRAESLSREIAQA